MFTLCLQWHCSAFTGQWVLPASPHQCLTCSPASGLCIFPCSFTPVSCRAAHLATTGCSISVHEALSPYPVTWLLRGNYFVFLEKTPPLFTFKILEILPLLGATVSFFTWCEVSSSPFLLLISCHHLQAHMKSQHPRHLDDPCDSLFTQIIPVVCDLLHWENPQLGQLHMQISYFTTASLSTTSVQNFLPPLFSPLFQSLISKLSFAHPKLAKFSFSEAPKFAH